MDLRDAYRERGKELRLERAANRNWVLDRRTASWRQRTFASTDGSIGVAPSRHIALGAECIDRAAFVIDDERRLVVAATVLMESRGELPQLSCGRDKVSAPTADEHIPVGVRKGPGLDCEEGRPVAAEAASPQVDHLAARRHEPLLSSTSSDQRFAGFACISRVAMPTKDGVDLRHRVSPHGRDIGEGHGMHRCCAVAWLTGIRRPPAPSGSSTRAGSVGLLNGQKAPQDIVGSVFKWLGSALQKRVDRVADFDCLHDRTSCETGGNGRSRPEDDRRVSAVP